MKDRHYLFIESNTTGTGALAVTRLLERSARVTFLARSPEKYPFLSSAASGLRVEALDTNDFEAVFAQIERVKSESRLDGVLTFSEFYVPLVAEVASRCGFPYLSPAAARVCRNKPETRKALRAAGLATPDFRLVRSEDEARQAATQITYPCVVKPPADSSSKGVRQVSDARELLEHFRKIHAWQENDRGQRLRGEALIESLIEGAEFSVETVTLAPGRTRVVGITAKHLSPPPLFVEVGHDFPALLDEDTALSLRQEVLAALEAVGFDRGPAHTEVRLTGAGPVIVEINPRLAGGMIPELVRHALGIDLLDAFLDQICNQPVDLDPRRAEWASIRFLTVDREGRLADVAGLEETSRLPLVREARVTRPVGAAVKPAEEAADRIGFVIASGPSRPEVLLQIEEAARRIRCTVRPESQDEAVPS